MDQTTVRSLMLWWGHLNNETIGGALPRSYTGAHGSYTSSSTVGEALHMSQDNLVAGCDLSALHLVMFHRIITSSLRLILNTL
jgi:hypothetical protein